MDCLSYICLQDGTDVCKKVHKISGFFPEGRNEGGGLPLLLAFQYLILMVWKACDLNLNDIFTGLKKASL